MCRIFHDKKKNLLIDRIRIYRKKNFATKKWNQDIRKSPSLLKYVAIFLVKPESIILDSLVIY